MPGDLPRDKAGQLALLDAMVFFSIAMLVSSVLVLQTEASSDATVGISDGPPTSVGGLLGALMMASIGQPIKIDLGPGLTVMGQESVAECLSAELYALGSGAGPALFVELNEAVLGLLDSLTLPAFRGCLVAVHPEGSSQAPALAIPGLPRASGLSYAASCQLPCEDGSLYTVTLVLQPAASSELV